MERMPSLLVGQKHVSEDFITKEEARDIVQKMPVFVSSVLVTHLEEAEQILPLAQFIGVNTIQLHSAIIPEEIQKIRRTLPFIKLLRCVHVIDESSLTEALYYENYVDGILLDTYNKDTHQVGGTGLTHDWSISREIIRQCHKPVILAGGLNSYNVEKVKQDLKPYAVDVNSGVKNDKGYKDYDKLKTFLAICKAP